MFFKLIGVSELLNLFFFVKVEDFIKWKKLNLLTYYQFFMT